jgi:4-diphosphocytidyl-2-methyl-D-erithritol synthase
MRKEEKKSNIGVVILAGGKGKRFHSEKQFVNFLGKPLWRYVYDKALQIVPKENIIVVGVDILGGKTRSFSVRNGLAQLCDIKKVLIIEAARPLLTVEQIQELIDTEGDSITFVAPCIDTIIMKDKTYLNRNDCLRMQTPQAFNFELLKKAYSSEDKYLDMTDETRVMFEEYSILPVFIEGGENLYKVTYPNDLNYLKRIIEQ